ncbi:hypothetical protein ACJX0J_017756, partial [Zea mays]
ALCCEDHRLKHPPGNKLNFKFILSERLSYICLKKYYYFTFSFIPFGYRYFTDWSNLDFFLFYIVFFLVFHFYLIFNIFHVHPLFRFL